MNLPRFGVRRPVTVMMIFSAVIIVGAVALIRLPIDLMPDIEPPFISVVTTYPGAAAEDVERKVTKIIENELAIVSDLKTISSISRENLSIVRSEFDYGVDLDVAVNDIRDRLEFAKRNLPEDAEEPMIFKFSTATFPVLIYGITAEESYGALRDIIDDDVADPLKRIPGVGAVQYAGGLERQISIRVDPFRLQSRGLTMAQVSRVLAAENLTLPAGSIKMGPTEYMLRVPGEFETVDEVRRVVVGRGGNGGVVYLEDVAQVEDDFKEQTYVAEIDGRRGMMLFVQKRSGTNAVEVVRRVQQKLTEEIIPSLPPDVEVNMLVDYSDYVVESIRSLTQTLLIGGALVALVTLLFLRRLASTLVIILTIPFSLILTFIFLFAGGYTINAVTLTILILAMGLVVDNAVVVLENIVRHVEQGERPEEAAEFGTAEVGLAVMASTLTTIAVLAPLVFVGGIMGVFFVDVVVVMSVTLLASLFAAVTLTPMLTSKLLITQAKAGTKRGLSARLYQVSERGFRRVARLYGALLRAALAHRLVVVLVAVLLFLAAVLGSGLGTQFFELPDTGLIQATAQLAVGTKVEETARVGRQIQQDFRRVIHPEELLHLSMRAGQSREAFGSVVGQKEGSHIVTVIAKLVGKNQRRRGLAEIANEVAQAVRANPAVVKLTVSTMDPIDQMLFAGGKELSFEIEGYDLERSDALARRIFDIVRATPGVRNPIISRDVGRPELRIEIDRDKAAALGLNVSDIAQTLRQRFYGEAATQFRQAERDYDIFPRLAEPFRRNLTDLRNTVITTPDGVQVPLVNIARLREATGPVEIERKDQERVVKVEAEIYGRSLGEVTSSIKEKLRELDVPQDLKVTVGGLSKEQSETFRDLSWALALGIVLVYMVMASQFESLRHPFVVMFSVPFAFVGVVLAFRLLGMSFDVMAFWGLVMLVGIVVNDAIVLVDYTNILRARGLTVGEAIVEAGERRLRPVLITTATTVFGMLPLAISTAEGAEYMRSLAVAVIGGLSVSTLITLVLVPTIYSLLEGRRAAPRREVA